MPEFAIQDDALKHHVRFRVFSWGAVLLLMGAAISLFVLAASGILRGLGLGLVFGILVFSTALGVIILASCEALFYAERQMVFVLDDNGISRRRKGYPEVRIAYSEVGNVREERRWLVVASIDPPKRIAIPNDVNGYEVIRTELARHHALATPAKFPLKDAALAIATIVLWAVVLWASDMRLLIPAGVAALIAFAMAFRHWWMVANRNPRRALLWLCFSLVWLSAILVVFFRVEHIWRGVHSSHRLEWGC